MAVEAANVQQMMGWLAQGGAVASSPAAEALVQRLAAVVFQGDAQWADRPEQADAHADALSAWLGAEESQFADLTKPDADPGVFVDWFLLVVAGWRGPTAGDGGAAAGLENPNFDGTSGTEFYRFDEAAQEYQYSSAADGGDWATYEQRRYAEPARSGAYGLAYRYDQRDGVYEWYDEAGGMWQDQAWADQHAAAGSGAAAQGPAAGSPAGPTPEWNENWTMFYRVDADGAYQFADAVSPGDEASGCSDVWLSQEQASARSAAGQRRPAAADPHAAAATALHNAMLAAVGSAFEADPELRDTLSDEHIKALLADVAREVIG
jgi:hypothetical protein